MKHSCFLLFLIFSISALCSQERKIVIYPHDSECASHEWHVSPRTKLIFDSDTATITCDTGTGKPVENPIAWIAEIGHMQFDCDTSRIAAITSDSQSEWRIQTADNGNTLVIIPASGVNPLAPPSVMIYDSLGKPAAGIPEWTGADINISFLPSGEYIAVVAGRVSLKFIK